jgi:hypothetical protein
MRIGHTLFPLEIKPDISGYVVGMSSLPLESKQLDLYVMFVLDISVFCFGLDQFF